MKTTEKQNRAIRGHACTLTSAKHSCELAGGVTIEGVRLTLCRKHRKLLRSIVADAKVADAKHRRSIGLKVAA